MKSSPQIGDYLDYMVASYFTVVFNNIEDTPWFALYSPFLTGKTGNLQKKSDILAITFRRSNDSKTPATCATETDSIVTTRTTKVTTHDPSDDQ